ncbi:MAG TPA: hypothetical protein VF845_08195 [Terriglobales bacterium]
MLKEKAAAELVTAIREVCDGGLYLGSGIYEYLINICFPTKGRGKTGAVSTKVGEKHKK